MMAGTACPGFGHGAPCATGDATSVPGSPLALLRRSTPPVSYLADPYQ